MSGSKLNVLNQKSRLLPYGQHKGMLMCCGCAKIEQPLPRCWLPYAVNAENKFVLQGSNHQEVSMQNLAELHEI